MAGWIWIAGGCLFVLVAGLFFVLGASVGASVTFEQFEKLILPLLSTAGSWVAGVGALGAVIVSLWLSEKQRREDVESVKINNSMGVELLMNTLTGEIGDEEFWYIQVEVISTGKRPVTIKSLEAWHKGTPFDLFLGTNYLSGPELPVTLPYGQSVKFIVDEEMFGKFSQYSKDEGLKDIRFRVNSTLETYEEPLSPALKGYYAKAKGKFTARA